MVVYRIDLLDDEGRTTISGHVVYPTDREVLHAAARTIGKHHALEIWDYTRVVGQLTAHDCKRLRAARQRPHLRPAAVAGTAMSG